jgi:hypothetical protein
MTPTPDLMLDQRSSIALLERVVVIEQKQRQLSDDTGIIRSTLHEIRGELQKLVLQEHMRKGERGAVFLMGSLLVGAVTIGGVIASAAIWIINLLTR